MLAGLVGIPEAAVRLRTGRELFPDAQPDPWWRDAVPALDRVPADELPLTAMVTTLGGADMLVFTGGIGEHDEDVRRSIRHDLAWAGVGGPSCEVLTLPSREEQQIARHMRVLAS